MSPFSIKILLLPWLKESHSLKRQYFDLEILPQHPLGVQLCCLPRGGDIPPRPAHTSHQQVIHQRGKQSTAEAKGLSVERETVGLGRLVPELLFPWDTHCFPPVGNSKHRELGCPSTRQLCAVGVTTTDLVGTLWHCCHSGSTGSWNPPDSLRPSKLCLAASTQRKLWNSC